MATDGSEIAPSATFVHCTPVYVNNLNQRTKIDKLSKTLRELFEGYGTILDIVAKQNVKARGQAFIVFDDVESAKEAIEELQDFELFGQEMHLNFAKTRSDATVQKEEGEEALEQHKRHRLAEKERKQAIEEANKPAKRAAQENLAERPAKSSKAASAMAGAVPDEYLPPNKTIFVQNTPDNYGLENLTTIFGRFAGFKEVRLVPGRKNIAFVEYENEDGAITAKEATGGMMLDDHAIKVTFQRK